MPNFGRKKLNSLGDDIEEVEARKHKQKDEDHSMKAEIKQILDNAYDIGGDNSKIMMTLLDLTFSFTSELDNLVFYFISTVSFFSDSTEIYPAEISLAKFSLKQGLYDDIQIRINPGVLPKGSAFDVNEKQKIHKYPLPPKCDGEQDYIFILKTMLEFLHPMESLPILFTETGTEKKSLLETRRIVEKIFYESQEDSIINVMKIYPVEELFYELQSLTVLTKNRQNGTKDTKFPSVVYAQNKFENDTEKYILFATGCDFHNNKDAAQHCCLSKVRSYGYTLARWCSNEKRYDSIEGKHYPKGFTT